jgi:EAL domain-containing protein (putative c-di-GMP-specific phosphodiesterase class I)
LVSPEYLELEAGFRRALSIGELRLFFQPLLSLNGFAVVGVEALLRWQHPDLGLVSPCSFIPMAEQGALIGNIGEWALLEQFVMECREKIGVEIPRIGIIVSPVQFLRRDFTRRVLDIVDRSAVNSRKLLLEITEGTVMQDLDFLVAQMNPHPGQRHSFRLRRRHSLFVPFLSATIACRYPKNRSIICP